MQDIRQALSDLQEDALSKARESSENPPNSVRKPRWWQRKQRVSEKPKGGPTSVEWVTQVKRNH